MKDFGPKAMKNETVDYIAPESWINTAAAMNTRQQVQYINLHTSSDSPSETNNLVTNTKDLNKDIQITNIDSDLGSPGLSSNHDPISPSKKLLFDNENYFRKL